MRQPTINFFKDIGPFGIALYVEFNIFLGLTLYSLMMMVFILETEVIFRPF